MPNKDVLEVAQRLVVDRDFRERFLIAPRAVLSDLGMPAEAYRTLVTILPLLLAGGVGLIKAAGADGVDPDSVGWGRGG